MTEVLQKIDRLYSLMLFVFDVRCSLQGGWESTDDDLQRVFGEHSPSGQGLYTRKSNSIHCFNNNVSISTI